MKEQYGKDTVLAGLVYYADKTCKRTIGAGDFYPIYLTLANFTSAVFSQPGTKVVAGFIPVLKRPDAAAKARWSICVKSIIMQCWKYHVDKLKELCVQGPVLLPLKGGRSLRVVPRFLYFVGDHPELQLVCGIFSGSTAAMPCRVCKVKQEDFGNISVEARADLRDADELKEIREQARQGFFTERFGAGLKHTRQVPINKTEQAYMLKQLSLSKCSPVFYDIPFQYLRVSPL